LSSALARSRKPKVAQEVICERLYRPLAHIVVVVLLPLRVPPPFVAAAAGATGIAAAVQLGQGKLLLAAILVQAKTVLDNADGQLARLSGRITAFGRYLDSELDLFVNAALFAGVAFATGRTALAAAGFVALTIVLSANYNGERLYRTEHGEKVTAMPETTGRAAGVLRAFYLLVYAPQDRFVARFVKYRLRDAGPRERVAYHDRATIAVLANLGMSTQLLVFGVCIALGQPALYAWIALSELGLVLLLAMRRERFIRVPQIAEEST
jgi:archaetidylinositol phosphate synthase